MIKLGYQTLIFIKDVGFPYSQLSHKRVAAMPVVSRAQAGYNPDANAMELLGFSRMKMARMNFSKLRCPEDVWALGSE